MPIDSGTVEAQRKGQRIPHNPKDSGYYDRHPTRDGSTSWPVSMCAIHSRSGARKPRAIPARYRTNLPLEIGPNR